MASTSATRRHDRYSYRVNDEMLPIRHVTDSTTLMTASAPLLIVTYAATTVTLNDCHDRCTTLRRYHNDKVIVKKPRIVNDVLLIALTRYRRH
jgi:hypothetical protein